MRIRLYKFLNRLTVTMKLRDPIIVYQMGKVGSLTIKSSLENLFRSLPLEVPLYHAHNLNNLDAMEAAITKQWSNPAPALAQMKIDKDLRRQIDNNPGRKWKVISLTRDPVARNVSMFFQMLDVHFPDWKSKYEQGHLNLQELQYFLVHKFSSGNAPELWFDQQMKPVFDIDVYASSFPHNLGYKIYSSNKNVKLLLIRLEDLDRVASQAMVKFLNIKRFSLIKSNVGAEKAYSALYREFKRMPLPKSYLEKMYNLKYTRHFYTDQEINKFYETWDSANDK